MNKEAITGKVLYQKYNCTACHQIYGLGGFLGPDLTIVVSQQGKGEAYKSFPAKWHTKNAGFSFK